MAYLNNAILMKAEFAKLCAEPWFVAITDQVVAQFGGRRIPEGGASVVVDVVRWMGQEALKANPDHPLMKDPLVLVKVVTALTADPRLQEAVAYGLSKALGQTE